MIYCVSIFNHMLFIWIKHREEWVSSEKDQGKYTKKVNVIFREKNVDISVMLKGTFQKIFVLIWIDYTVP